MQCNQPARTLLYVHIKIGIETVETITEKAIVGLYVHIKIGIETVLPQITQKDMGIKVTYTLIPLIYIPESSPFIHLRTKLFYIQKSVM